VGSVGRHFAGKPAALRELFERIVEIVAAHGPVVVLPEKTRIAFHVRMSFMVISVQRSALRGHFVFAERQPHPRFTRVITYSPRNHVHEFRVTALSDLDEEFKRWVSRAYRVGEQRHLSPDVTTS
jgi:hypothetical protein